MKLWHVFRPGSVGYDEYDAFIVRANSEQDARELCSKRAADEGASVWLSSKHSICNEVIDEGRQEILLGSFCAG